MTPDPVDHGTVFPAAMEFDIPQRSGEWLCLPPASQFRAVAARNAQLLAASSAAIAGVPLAEVRRQARAEVAQAAAAFTRGLGVPHRKPQPTDLLLVTGHQPFLFHPGIWIKHLLVDRLAREGVAALSMPVDSDVAEDVGADVPRLEQQGLRLVHETLVQTDADVPYEAVPAPSGSQWEAFVGRLRAHLQTLGVREPLAALEAFDRVANTGAGPENLGPFLIAARRRYEGTQGAVELPVSLLSAGVEFKRFVLHLVRDAGRFAETYNRHLGAYRDRYNIRTTAQPFPDLQRDGDRQELPFWIVRGGRRRPLFVQRAARSLQVLAGSEPVTDVPDAAGPEVLSGVPVRPRALTLTAFTRLCVADLFVHGVGGGRYDRLTDAVMREYFGLQPPAYAVVSATLHLPLQAYDAASERQAVQRRLLDLQHNPDRALAQPTTDQQVLIAEKWGLIAKLDGGQLTRRERREATHRIREINEALTAALANERSAAEARLAALEGAGDLTAATYRGYPYCFFAPAAVNALVHRMLAED